MPCRAVITVLTLLACTPLSADDPRDFTWIEKKDDKWDHLHTYLGGSSILIDDVKSNRKARFNLEELIAPDNYQRHVRKNTSPPMWEQSALAYFLTINDTDYFCIRLAWDERIILNLNSFEPAAPGSVDLKLLLAREKAVVHERLDNAVNLLAAGDLKIATRWQEINAAISFVERQRLIDCIPQLRKLEECSLGRDFPAFENNSIPTRRLAQFALRRLGEKPQAYPAIILPRARFDVYEKPFNKPFADRINNADTIKTGLGVVEALNTLGTPDYINNTITYGNPSTSYWRYDMDADPPYTLVIIMQHDAVHEIRRYEPPLWQEMDHIEKASPHPVFKPDGDLRIGVHERGRGPGDTASLPYFTVADLAAAM